MKSATSHLRTSSQQEIDVLGGPLHLLGFEILHISSEKVTGRLQVNHKCVQPFKMLNGGVSALIAETLASTGAVMASGMKKAAGIHLSIDHLKPAMLGDVVFAEATPLTVGKIIQVWETRLYKLDLVDTEKRSLISTARVTVLTNMPLPESAKEFAEKLKNLAAKL